MSYNARNFVGRIAESATGAFNADFDGDEMNVSAVRSETTAAETACISSVESVSLRDSSGSMVAGLVQGVYVAIVEMTSVVKATIGTVEPILNKDQVLRLLPPGCTRLPPPYAAGKARPAFSSRVALRYSALDVVGMAWHFIVPPLNFSRRGSGDLRWTPVVVDGKITKDVQPGDFGKSPSGILYHIARKYSEATALRVLDNLRYIGAVAFGMFGTSVNIRDCQVRNRSSVGAGTALTRKKPSGVGAEPPA